MKKLFLILIFCLLFISSTNAYELDLEKIVVTSSKIEQTYRLSTQNISIITKEDIESSGIDEITEILDLLPSVDILEYGSIGSTRSVHTRGSSTEQVLTLIDGRPVNTPRDGLTDFNQIPLSNIERIEVLRGPATSIYGANAVGGVINIVTKSGRKNKETELTSKFGSFATKYTSLTHGDAIKDFDYFIAYDYLASHGHRDALDYLSHNVNTKFGYQLNDDNRISVSSGYYNSEVGAPGPVASPEHDKHETFKKYVDIIYNGKWIKGQDLLIKLFHNYDRLEFIEEYNPIDKDTHLSKVYGVDTQISQTFFDIFRTAIGVSYQDHRLNSSINAKPSYHLSGVYFESETDFFNNGALKFGLRRDEYSNFGDKLNPSASFNFWLFDTVKVHALAAKSFRAPTFNDLYWPTDEWFPPALSDYWPLYGRGAKGNLDLGPEKAISYEAGISGYLFNRFKTDLTFFKTTFEDLIEWQMDSAYWWKPTNVTSAAIKGVELETEFIIREHLKANFNYTYLEAKDKHTKKWLIYRPRHLYKLRLVYSPTPKYELGLSAIHKSKRFTNTNNTSLLEHASVLNLNFTYNVNDNFKLILEAKNIFDRQYEEERGYSMPGRAFYGGFRLSF